jgi:crossover junction endodeoxyribonuclease RuvC
MLRGVLHEAGAARVRAYVEQVNAMPSIPGPDGVRRGMGSSSAFRFGESFGVLKGVLAALGIRYELIAPQTWKKSQGLTGSEKDYARTVAIRTFPDMATHLARKKDIGRADALLIARHATR